MPGTQQTLAVPPPVSVPTLLYGIYQAVQNGGGGGGSAITGEGRLWFSDTPPAGWLICDGTLLAIVDYPELYAVIGTTYGGDGIATFSLPNLENRVPAGRGGGDFVNLGDVAGNATVTITESNLPPLSTTTNNAESVGSNLVQVVTGVSYSPSSGQGLSVIQPSLVVNFIIKT